MKQKEPPFQDYLDKILKFRKDRDWEQFSTPKDDAIALTLEASEVLEHFQWKSKEEMDNLSKEQKNAIGEELVDVLYWVLLLAHNLDVDLVETYKKKMKENEKKYPVEKAKGKHLKYTEL